ncbi:MAG: transcriptional regulator [Firmicutes bacterium]|nr:transcriptional regulator [Bacillota bacterium]
MFSGFQIINDLLRLRWVPEILRSIDFGNHRYIHILESIPNMSHTELNRKLSLLMEKRVIGKEIRGNIGKYVLLDFGKDLIHIFHHLEDIQQRYCQPSA